MKVGVELNYASCPSRWSYPYFITTLHSPLATGLGLIVSTNVSLALAYSGVQEICGNGEASNGHSRVVDFALPPRVTAVLFVQLRLMRHD